MERTVPRIASEEIELYLRTYYSLLRTTAEVNISTLEETHAGMRSLLHLEAREERPDMSAFIYCLLRLPPVMPGVQLVVLGQSLEMFAKHGFGEVETWELATAKARRRQCFYDGSGTLACLIASRTDIDDVVPLLTAYQIEWNKLHRLLREIPEKETLPSSNDGKPDLETLAAALQLEKEDVERLKTIWGEEFSARLEEVAEAPRDLRIQLLSGSLNEYRRITRAWWERIEEAKPILLDRPVYFVSSNPHSLVNITTGFALEHQDELVAYLEHCEDRELLQEWEDIQSKDVPSSRENFIYYLLKKMLQTPEGEKLRKARQKRELECDIVRVEGTHSFDIEAQVIEVAKINPERMDPRLRGNGSEFLEESDALILNIDYPLGLAAYDILGEVGLNVGEILGVYMVGKAATLNGIVGDVLLPNVVYDGHSRNTYLFSNGVKAGDVQPHLVYGNVLDNQKAVTVRGTYLQNAPYMDVFYREGYTDIEMEAGPYLSAVYELTRPKRHPIDEIVNLYECGIDLGILHYASDTPLSKGKNLGAGSLSYFGMDPAYATTLAVMKRIFKMEQRRLKGDG